MKKLILLSLKLVMGNLSDGPLEKTSTHYENITDVKPYDLLEFMIFNKIPNSCYFYYDEHNRLFLAWTVLIPTTEKDRRIYRAKRFERLAFPKVYHSLISNGYTRISPSSIELRLYKDLPLYDLYINKEYDRLISYYSLFFKK